MRRRADTRSKDPMKKDIFVVAEVSANHGQSLKRAVALIKEAKRCGADAVKFQTYTPDTITINSGNKHFRVKHAKWGGQTLYQLYKKAYTPWEWFKELKRTADDEGIVFFSTAFDKASVDLLERLDVPAHKIASFEIVDLPLIKYAAKTKKPLIISTGMSTASEIREALDAARGAGAKDITLLKCVSRYPADPGQINLSQIPLMRRMFKCSIGLSDHTLGIGASVAAAALGANFIEKHFTLSRKLKTPDSFFSIEPEELRNLVDNVKIAKSATGKAGKTFSSGDKKNRVFRRSLFAVEDIKKGDKITEKNVRSIRPAAGLHPRYFEDLMGKRSKRRIKRGEPFKWNMIK
jgi:pseudaminic acid synthase